MFNNRGLAQVSVSVPTLWALSCCWKGGFGPASVPKSLLGLLAQCSSGGPGLRPCTSFSFVCLPCSAACRICYLTRDWTWAVKARNPDHEATKELPPPLPPRSCTSNSCCLGSTLWVPAGRGLGWRRSLSSAGERKNPAANQNVL